MSEILYSKKVRKDVYAEQMYNGIIRIADRCFLGYTMTRAIRTYRQLSPAHPAKQAQNIQQK